MRDLKTCTKVELGAGDFQLRDNNVIFVSDYNKTLAAEEFFLVEGGTAIVCQPQSEVSSNILTEMS